MLREADMFIEFMSHRLQRQWRLGGSIVGDLFLSTTFRGAAGHPTLYIEGNCFGRRIKQTVRLASKPMRFGGKRWHFVCPQTGRPCYKLVLPPSEHQFASVGGWGVGYRTQRVDAVTRAQLASRKLQRRLRALPKRARHHTIAGLAGRIAAKEGFLDRVVDICGNDLANGRRISARRAAKLAMVERAL